MNDNEQKQLMDEEIPLLEDVISPAELASEYQQFTEIDETSDDSAIPEYDEVLLAMRDDIARQLEDDLRMMISNALDRAIGEAAGQIVRTLHDELDSTLEQRIRYLIDQRLTLEFGPRNQHDPQP
jgi:hypothetical protein